MVLSRTELSLELGAAQGPDPGAVLLALRFLQLPRQPRTNLPPPPLPSLLHNTHPKDRETDTG